MQNHWLSNARGKQLLKEIDEIAMDVLGDDGTLSDFFASLSDEQTDLLFEMKIKDFVCDPEDQSLGFELKGS